MAVDTYQSTVQPSNPSARAAGPVLGLIAVGLALPAYNEGTLTVADGLILLVLVPVVLFALSRKQVAVMWAFAALWLGAQVLTDYWNGTPHLSGASLTGAVAALLATALLYLQKELCFSTNAAVLAMGIGWIGLEVIVGSAAASENPWKYGMAPAVIVTVLAALSRWTDSHRVHALGALAMAGISVYFDSRFYAGVLVLTALLISRLRTPRTEQRKGGSRKKAVFLVAVSLVAVYLSYPILAVNGYLGERAQIQQRAFELTGTNFLLANRMEPLQIGWLVAHHPILGIGSKTPIPMTESSRSVAFVKDVVGPLDVNQEARLHGHDSGNLGYVEHTQALGAMLNAGILAAGFWIWLWLSVGRTLVRLPSGTVPLPAVTLFMCLCATWDSVFSPLTTRTHIPLALTLFLILTTLAGSQREPRAGEDVPS